MNLSAPFINRPVMTTFIMLTILVAGWLAFLKLPVSDLPSIEHPHIQVRAAFTGASAEAVLNQVTIPLEKELTHVKGVQEISSESGPGSSSISLSFDLSKNMDEAIRDVQSAINRAEGQLPELDQRPTYHLQEDSQESIMYLMMTNDNGNMGELSNFADTYVIPRLSRIEGVAQVITFGPGKSTWIRLNPELMAARQIGFNDVVNTISQYTEEMPLGRIQTTSKSLTLELSGTIKQAKELENLRIGSSPVRIRDIGEISDQSPNDQEVHLVANGKTTKTLILGIQKVNDGNTVAISKGVRKAMAILNKELPSTIHLEMWFDKAVWIDESILDVEWTLLFAFALVVLVIYFSLGRLSEALIASVALPLSLVGTLIAMYLLNFNLDLLSLLALTLSVGFVVDDAIVVLENIVRFREQGVPPREASLRGSKQICFTILSMTVSLVAVFIPLLFMSGINGRLFREFSITLSVAILVSGFISLTLTPMLCSRFLSAHKGENKLQKTVTAANGWLAGLYGKTLKWCFRFPKTILLVAISCVALTAFLFPKLTVNLIPPEDRGYIMAFVNLPSGIGSDSIKKYQTDLEEIVKQNTSVDKLLDINWGGNLVFIMRLLPHAERPPQDTVIAALQKVIDEVPGTQTFIQGYKLINIDFEMGGGGQYEFELRGPEFKDVEEAAELLTTELKKLPEFPFVQSSVKNDSPKLIVKVNDEQAHKLGFNKQDIQGLLMQAYGQGTAGTIQRGNDQESIYMELLPEYQNHAGALSKLYLTAPGGDLVPLKALAEWEEKLGSPSLHRLEQMPSTSVKFSLLDTVPPNEGMKIIEEMASKVLPDNVKGELAGAAKAISSTINDTLFLLLAAAVVMYIVLGILYESFIHPLTILSSLPFAGLGGVLTLLLFGEPVSIFSAVGFLLLIGIVKKNGIMMVDYALEAQKQGVKPEQAIFEGCLVRFRPIMMTTVAAIMGAIPIAIGFGDGSEMRRGLGLVIVGGLLFSQVLTLYVTPILYLTFEKLRFSKPGVVEETVAG
jgi:HAE1 family hydrophobic/amphiphilic exporter-1